MTAMNIIAIVTFIIGVPGIGWMIWNQEKVIRFEQRLRDRIVGLAAAAVVFVRHEVMLRRKGRVK